MTIPPEIVDALVALITALASYAAYRAKTTAKEVEQIKEKVEDKPETLVIVDPMVNVAGQWSDEAREALNKAIPVGAEILNVVDSPDYHIVYWRVKR